MDSKSRMATDKMAPDMQTTRGDSMMASDNLIKKVSSYCQDHPDMMVKDAS